MERKRYEQIQRDEAEERRQITLAKKEHFQAEQREKQARDRAIRDKKQKEQVKTEDPANKSYGRGSRNPPEGRIEPVKEEKPSLKKEKRPQSEQK